jgi:hypothetical protein
VLHNRIRTLNNEKLFYQWLNKYIKERDWSLNMIKVDNTSDLPRYTFEVVVSTKNKTLNYIFTLSQQPPVLNGLPYINGFCLKSFNGSVSTAHESGLIPATIIQDVETQLQSDLITTN